MGGSRLASVVGGSRLAGVVGGSRLAGVDIVTDNDVVKVAECLSCVNTLWLEAEALL